MAPAARSGRFSPASPRTALTPQRILLSCILLLLLLASLCALIASNHIDLTPNPARAANQDPVRTRLELIHRQAADHVALINAYAAFSRRSKLESARAVRTFEDLVGCFTSLLSRLPRPDDPVEDEPLRSLEKELKDRVKLARQLVADSKESFDTQIKIQKLRDTVFAVGEQLSRERKLGDLSSKIAAGSTPKTLHCIAMRLMEERILHPEAYRDEISQDLDDPGLFHCVIVSDNVVAAAVVINSAVRAAAEPGRLAFHVITDGMHLAAFQVWFRRRPPAGGARVEVLKGSEGLDWVKFDLPEVFPKLKKVVLLEDDVVVQRDLAGLWKVDLGGKVNGAVETCFGPFRRYSKYVNFSHPAVREKLNARACAWAFGVNVFDLEAWRREKCTDRYRYYRSLNEDGSLWNPDSTLPAGLLTFDSLTKPLDKSWHVMGLGYNPSISPDQIDAAAVIHFDGNMKPWLDIAMNQYKNLWMKHVDTDMEFLQLCNFGL